MYGFRANFLAGLLIGAVLAIAPWAGASLLANTSTPASASEQTAPPSVNRAGKSDRLHPARKVTNEPRKAPAKILEGCDPAFSPLSKGAASANFSSRCLV